MANLKEALNRCTDLEASVNALNLAHDGILTRILSAAKIFQASPEAIPLRVFLVGGGVRDLILGREVRDLDVLVEGDIMAIADRLKDLDWQFYDRFMTASAVLDTGEIDLITARREWYEAPGQLPVVEAGKIEDDLKRRDFTVNAMALELKLEQQGDSATESGPSEGENEPKILIQLHDPLGGLEDLQTGLLRVLHDRSFYDDPTRLYRAVRYMARLGLTPVDQTLAQMRLSVAEGVLETLSNDRLMRELLLNFSEASSSRIVQGLLEHHLIPMSETLDDSISKEDTKEALNFAAVVEKCGGLCGEDQAGCLFGYFSLKSEIFAQRFQKSSVSRRIKAAARAVKNTSPEDLANSMALNTAVSLSVIQRDSEEQVKDTEEASIESVSTRTKSRAGTKPQEPHSSGLSPQDESTSPALTQEGVSNNTLPQGKLSEVIKTQESGDGAPSATVVPEAGAKSSAYAVRLDAFEGPMDLLLHLIQDNEIDIYDIPVATLCTQYLDYLTNMENARVDVAGEFLVMAATLLEIKSMMLLPDREAGLFEAWDEAEDPRTELVTKLVEYKRYKEAARQLKSLEMTEGAYYTREASDLSEVVPADPEKMNEPTEIELLSEALRRVLMKLDRTDTHRENFFSTMHREPYAVEDAMRVLTDRLKGAEAISFESLFEDGTTRNIIVTTFLALLELLKLKRVSVVQDGMFSGILIQRREPGETEEALIQETLLEHWYETSASHKGSNASDQTMQDDEDPISDTEEV